MLDFLKHFLKCIDQSPHCKVSGWNNDLIGAMVLKIYCSMFQMKSKAEIVQLWPWWWAWCSPVNVTIGYIAVIVVGEHTNIKFENNRQQIENICKKDSVHAFRVPHGLMVIAVDFWIPWLETARVQTPGTQLEWVGFSCGRGGWPLSRQRSTLLSGVNNIYAPARLHLDGWTKENWPKQH